MSVGSGKDFSFTIVGKDGVDYARRAETDSVVLELTDEYGSDPKTLYLKINYLPTSIHGNDNQKQAKSIAVNVLPGSISFMLKKAGSISASLYSVTGKKVAVLLDNQTVTEKETYTSLTALQKLSNGLYLLKCKVVNSDGVMRIEKRVTLVK